MPELETVVVDCAVCHKQYILPISAAQVTAWRNGNALVQHVFSQLSADERELLMTKTCGTCFDRIFKDVE